ncbi:hypothetical protein AAC387_Pa05g3670 [Persea americana]
MGYNGRILLGFSFADCFDPLDPNGNVTVKFDIHGWTSNGYLATVTIQNYYQYRHVEKPGWQLGWTWTNTEVILSMTGAIATQKGNCSINFQSAHSCTTDPVIVDLMPDAAAVNRTENCCRDGLLSSWAIDQANSISSFEIDVGNLGHGLSYLPLNPTFMGPGPGYTCSPFLDAPPTVSTVFNARREEQVFGTWKSICTYSTFTVNKAPTCCVSLSTFYNPKITPCPLCSCECRPGNSNTLTCVGDDLVAASGPGPNNVDNLLQCTDHMCPVRVHWHIKNNYRDHWRVKLTVSNYHYGANFSDWNVLVQHPNFGESLQSYSFNSTTIQSVANSGARLIDDVALFWGLANYNKELLQASEEQPGSVTTEILLSKDQSSFTLNNGWAFPRKIYFNGENCEMPLPDDFPALPGTSTAPKHTALSPPLLLLYTMILQVVLGL